MRFLLSASFAALLLLASCGEPTKGVGDPGSVFPGAMSATPAVLPKAVHVAGQYAVQYELILQNEGTTDIEIRGVVAVNQNGEELEQLDREEFARRTSLKGGVLPAGERAVLRMVALADQLEDLETLSHRIQMAPAGGKDGEKSKAYTVAGGVLKVDGEAPSDFGPPVGPGKWLVQGPLDPSPGAQQTIEEIEGTLVLPRRFQVSLTRLTSDGATSSGSGSTNEDYPSFGADVLAMTGGVVVQVENGLDDHAPGRPDRSDPVGNFVLVETGTGLYVVYEGLRKGSVSVRAGDRVPPGARLGAIGNTGLSVEPELRVRLLSAPDVRRATSLEFGFRTYRWGGWMEGVPRWDALVSAMSAGAHKGETPPSGSIVQF
ncbi:MAG: M23 family metallopeptidase [Armatimonadetes bacterium]|nr:MAG: M23 family metallopeptidase [Armatimonadota bacterium]